jgi:hypothetical protein
MLEAVRVRRQRWGGARRPRWGPDALPPPLRARCMLPLEASPPRWALAAAAPLPPPKARQQPSLPPLRTPPQNGTLDALVLDSYVLQFAAASTCDLATVGGVWQQVGASGQPAPHSAAEGRPARPWHHLCPTALLPPPPAPSRPVLWRRCFPLGLQRHRAAGRLQLHAGRHTEVGWAQLAGCRGTVPLAQGGSPARCRGRSRAAGCCRAVRAVVAGDMEALFSQYVDPPQPACKTSGVGDTTSQVTFSQVGGRLRWTLECRRSHAVCVAVLFGEA